MRSVPPPLVAHVIFRLDFGGLENGLVNIINGIPADRYRHVIICLAGYNAKFRRRIRRPDVEVLDLGKKPGKDLPAYARMWRLLRRLHPDIVHTRNLGTVDMQWVAAAAAVPHRIHGEHGWEASDPYGMDPKGLRIRRSCRPVIQRYVPMSRDIACWLENKVGVHPARIRQLYNGVDTDRFRPNAEGFRQVTHPIALGESLADTLVIGTVGRLDPVKNQGALIGSLRSILDRDPILGRRLRLTIVGDGPMRGELEDAVASCQLTDKVWFAGARDDMPDLLRSMDLFVAPSLNEGISNTILEAMATGLPVVAGRVGGNPELVVEGATGALYDKNCPEAMESAILRYVADPALREKHGEAGRQRALRDFSLDAMVHRYLDLYDESMGWVPESRLRPPQDLLGGHGSS